MLVVRPQNKTECPRIGKVKKMARILPKYLSGDDDNNNEGMVKNT